MKVNVIIIFDDVNSVSIVNPDSIPSLDESDKPDIVPSHFPNFILSYDPTHIQCSSFDPTDSLGSKLRHVSNNCSSPILYQKKHQQQMNFDLTTNNILIYLNTLLETICIQLLHYWLHQYVMALFLLSSSLCSQPLLNKLGNFFDVMIDSLSFFVSLFAFLSGMNLYCSCIPPLEFQSVNFIHAKFFPIYIIWGYVEILSHTIITVLWINEFIQYLWYYTVLVHLQVPYSYSSTLIILLHML